MMSILPLQRQIDLDCLLEPIPRKILWLCNMQARSSDKQWLIFANKNSISDVTCSAQEKTIPDNR